MQGLVVRKSISANPRLKVVQGLWFSSLKAVLLLILWDNLKAAKVKLLSENNLLEFTSLSIKSELKFDAN